ncbi:MAG: lysophospholipid acyltransferase family protein [Acetobacteraceae bacterium]|nr:lysophospholipid acyltransferase family protein [Acetobacteraceae bacterium]
MSLGPAGLDEALFRALRRLPTPLVSGIGGALGRLLAARRAPEAVARARAAVAVLRPDLSAAEQAALVARAAENVGRLLAEHARLHRLWPEGRISFTGEEHVIALVRAGKPVIGITCHTGNWEAIASAAHAFRLPLAVVYRPPRSALERRIAAEARARTGLRLLPPGLASAVEAVKILEGGREILGFFVDESAGGDLMAPRFGRPQTRRGNMAIAIRLALRHGAEILPVWSERLPGPRFRVAIGPPFALQRHGGDEEALLAANLPLLDRALEAWIRPRLDQWYGLFRLRGIG